jgi:cytochrome c oxidase subunit 2
MNELMRRLLALPEQASTVAPGIDALHYVVIGISVLGAAGVTVAVIVFLVRFHARSGYTPPRRARRLPLWIEIVAIAGLLGMFLAFWVVGFTQFVRLQTPPKGAMDVYVVAKQWMWTFAYPDGNAAQGDLYVPVGRPVRLLLTSRDVIHSFYVPAFRVKQDAVPGRQRQAWFEATRPGAYDILCAEYCGTEHSRMRGRVIVLDEAAWTRWAEGGDRRGEDLATAGARIAAERGCLRCHTLDGTPHLGPTWAGVYGSMVELAGGERVRADESYLTESMMDPERKLRAGYAPIMPTYRGLLDAAEVAAIVELIRSLPAAPVAHSPLPAAPLPAAPIVEAR